MMPKDDKPEMSCGCELAESGRFRKYCKAHNEAFRIAVKAAAMGGRNAARDEIKKLCDGEVAKGFDGCPHDESLTHRTGGIDMADHISATISLMIEKQ